MGRFKTFLLFCTLFTGVFGQNIVPTQAQLAEPDSNGVNVDPLIQLKWYTVPTATSYRLQVSMDSNFITDIIHDTTLTDTSKQMWNLINGNLYYWRVKGNNAGGAGSYSPVWMFRTIFQPPVQTAPANGAVNQNINTQLRWNAITIVTAYQVQVATDSLFTNIVRDTSVINNSATVRNLTNLTKYYWRVRGTMDNSLGLWSQTWSFTTVIQVPEVVYLAQPDSNSLNVDPSIILRWNKAERAVSYRLQVSTNANFSQTQYIIQDTTLADTSKIMWKLSRGTIYYWRVRGNNDGGGGAYSSIWRFTTVHSSPLLTSPVNGTVNSPLNPTLRWQQTASGFSYQVQPSTDTLFQVIVTDTVVNTNLVTIRELEPFVKYYWRVRVNNEGNTGLWSLQWNFLTLALPTASVPLYPGDNSVNVVNPVTFRWSKSINFGAEKKYWLQVAADSLNTIIYNDSTLTDTFRTRTLNYDKTYWWRIKAGNEAGWTEFSDWITFRTIVPAPVVPVLNYPTNNSTGLPENVLLKWLSQGYAERYHLQIAADSSFVSLIVNDSTVTDTTYLTDSLLTAKNYFWRVKAVNVAGSSSYSQKWNFKTYIPPVNKPSGLAALPQPGNMVLLTWNDNSANESGFMIFRKEGDSAATGNFMVIDSRLSVSTSFVDTTIHVAGAFTYLVVAFNADTISDSSNYATLVLTSIEDEYAGIPDQYYLSQNYPNPFNGGTIIRFGLPQDDYAEVTVFNISGEKVATLVREEKKAGHHLVHWNGMNDFHLASPSGIYFFQIRTKNYQMVKKMIYLK